VAALRECALAIARSLARPVVPLRRFELPDVFRRECRAVDTIHRGAVT